MRRRLYIYIILLYVRPPPRQERLRKRQEGPADPRFRQQRLRKLSLRQRSRFPLSESQQRRDDRLSRRRERERKRRLRKQQRNERYAWGGVGRETELGGLLRLWRLQQLATNRQRRLESEMAEESYTRFFFSAISIFLPYIYARAMFVSHAPWIYQPLIRPPWHYYYYYYALQHRWWKQEVKNDKRKVKYIYRLC